MLLAIDTATHVLSLALHDGQRLLIEYTWTAGRRHNQVLAPQIASLLAEVGAGVADLEAVAVAQGPGSYMGLRTGMGVAKGLAISRRLKLVAVPTLDIVASAQARTRGSLMAVLQAGRGRICAQRYSWRRSVGGWAAKGGVWLGRWEDLLQTIEKATTVCGEIDRHGAHLLGETERPVSVTPGAHGLRRAGFLAELAWARVGAGDTDDPFMVAPIYVS